MGNQASAAMAVANAKSQLKGGMKDLNERISGQPKDEKDGLAGCANRKESQQRRKERQEDYKKRQTERAERKKALSEKWASHRQMNSAAQKKSWIPGGSK